MPHPELKIPFKKYRLSFKGITGGDGAADIITRLNEEQLKEVLNYNVDIKSCKEYKGKIIED